MLWLNVPSAVRTVICFRDVASGRGWRWDHETWMSMRSVAFVWAPPPTPNPPPHTHTHTHTHHSLSSKLFFLLRVCYTSSIRFVLVQKLLVCLYLGTILEGQLKEYHFHLHTYTHTHTHTHTHTTLSLQSYFFASRLLYIVNTLRVGAEIIGLSVPKHHTRRAVKGIPFTFVSVSKFHDKGTSVRFCVGIFYTKNRWICLRYFQLEVGP